jgi:hypothetical protein
MEAGVTETAGEEHRAGTQENREEVELSAPKG